MAASFHAAGILVHACLMYGLRGETIAESIDALERVRQLFAKGLLQSAFWHRFVATAHSPVGLDPAAHGIRITGPSFGGFAESDLTHEDAAGHTPAWLGVGLRRAVLSYMEGEDLTTDLRRWFERPVPRPAVPRTWVASAMKSVRKSGDPAPDRKLVWIGGGPVIEPARRGRSPGILPRRATDAELGVMSGQAGRQG